MSGSISTIKASTLKELEAKVLATIKELKEEYGLPHVRAGWDPERVIKTTDGYQIDIWVGRWAREDLLEKYLRDKIN